MFLKSTVFGSWFATLGAHQRIFPYVGVFGPIGWVSAGFLVGVVNARNQKRRGPGHVSPIS